MSSTGGEADGGGVEAGAGAQAGQGGLLFGQGRVGDFEADLGAAEVEGGGDGLAGGQGAVEVAAFERSAAPITIIDGEKVLGLLIDNGIGASKRPLQYVEFALAKLAQIEGEADEEDET